MRSIFDSQLKISQVMSSLHEGEEDFLPLRVANLLPGQKVGFNGFISIALTYPWS